MRHDYIPAAEGQLWTWSANFLANISTDPTALGLTQAQVDTFAAAQADYAAKYQTACDPNTRTSPAVEARNASRGTMLTLIRQLVRIIQACPTVTDEQRVALMITVRKSPVRTPTPAARPGVTVLSVTDRTVTARLRNTDSPTSGAKPDGAAGAKLFTCIGHAYPADPALWTYRGDTTKMNFKITFPFDLPPGTQVWISAAWYNRRGETGPPGNAATTNLQGGGVTAAEMKIAA